MFPPAAPIPRVRCRRCGQWARQDRAVQGYGSECAALLGLTGGTVDVGQDGPTLLDLLDEDADMCDGWDR